MRDKERPGRDSVVVVQSSPQQLGYRGHIIEIEREGPHRWNVAVFHGNCLIWEETDYETKTDAIDDAKYLIDESPDDEPWIDDEGGWQDQF